MVASLNAGERTKVDTSQDNCKRNCLYFPLTLVLAGLLYSKLTATGGLLQHSLSFICRTPSKINE